MNDFNIGTLRKLSQEFEPLKSLAAYSVCDSYFLDRLRKDPELKSGIVTTAFGFEIRLDPTLPPNVCEFRDRSGKVLQRFEIK